jgi:hypothetical protein
MASIVVAETVLARKHSKAASRIAWRRGGVWVTTADIRPEATPSALLTRNIF